MKQETKKFGTEKHSRRQISEKSLRSKRGQGFVILYLPTPYVVCTWVIFTSVIKWF